MHFPSLRAVSAVSDVRYLRGRFKLSLMSPDCCSPTVSTLIKDLASKSQAEAKGRFAKEALVFMKLYSFVPVKFSLETFFLSHQ